MKILVLKILSHSIIQCNLLKSTNILSMERLTLLYNFALFALSMFSRPGSLKMTLALCTKYFI